MINYERIKVSKLVDTIHYCLTGNIDDAIRFLQKMKVEYPDGEICYEDVGRYETDYSLTLRIMVDETDNQYAKRIANEERDQKWREENEREQYEALKAKFEGE